MNKWELTPEERKAIRDNVRKFEPIWSADREALMCDRTALAQARKDKRDLDGIIAILEDVRSRHLKQSFHNNRVKSDTEDAIKIWQEYWEGVE